MPASAFNLARWMDRMGWKRADEPPVLYSVQPVQIVNDASALTPPMLPNAALLGGRQNAVAGQFGMFQIHSVASGGTWIDTLNLGNTTTLGFRTVATRLAFETGPLALNPQEIEGNIEALGQIGTTDAVTAALFNDGTLPQAGVLASVWSRARFLIPQGQVFCCVSDAPNLLIRFTTVILEPPFERGS